MSFLSWHYTHGLRYYVQRYIFSLQWLNHYFSLKLLLKSLFAPWKRLLDNENKPGFHPLRELEKLSFNLISRFIGAIVRLSLFFIGLSAIFFVAIAGFFGFVLWLTVPLLSFPVYQKFNTHPKIVVGKIQDRVKLLHPIRALSESYAGHFVLDHLGADKKLLVERAQTVNVNWEVESASTLVQLMKILLKAGLWTEEFLRAQNITQEDILTAAQWWDKKAMEKSYINDNPSLGRPGVGLGLLYGYTPILNKASSDLGTPQAFSHHLIGRGNVVNRMERNLANGQNIVLTGKPGVGKHTVILEFARMAGSGELGKNLAYQRVLELDYSSVLAGSEDTAQKKTLLSEVFAEAANAGNIILVIRDIHRLTDPELEGIDMTDVLEQYIQKGGLRIISTVSDVEYERFISRNLRLKKYFEIITVQQPTQEEAFEILVDAADTWEKKSGITIAINALRLILTGSDKYITQAPFPEKAIELLDATVAYVQGKSQKILTVEDVKTILAEKTGISFVNMTSERKDQLSRLEEIIHERLINQESAVNLIAKTLRSKTVGVVNNIRPLGSFLFLGPTGVGKTETAKVLAKVYFGSESKMIRFNMAEYSGREGMERLIGAIDKNLPGALTSAIEKNPTCLLLLDEVEKSPPGIHNLLLSLLDEGEMNDAFDRTIKAQNIFIVATSNAGAEAIRQLVQQGIRGEQLQQLALDNIMQQQLFSPELLNRFDGVVVYEPLDRQHLYKVAEILTKELALNLKEKNIYLSFSDEAIKKIADEGYEPAFGARPMRRLIELHIGDMIGRAMLNGEIIPGSKVEVVPRDGKNLYAFRDVSSQRPLTTPTN